MARQVSRMILGMLLGAVVGWLWLRRQHMKMPEAPPLAPTSETDERIVLPAWTEVDTTPPSAVQGRIVLPDGTEADAGGEGDSDTGTQGGEGQRSGGDRETGKQGEEEQRSEGAGEQGGGGVEPSGSVATSMADAAPVEVGVGVASEGYCVRCKEQRPMVNMRQYMTANKRPAVKGECGVCGAGMFKFIKE